MRLGRVHNVIFPLWLAIFFPPYILIPLLGNLLIDGGIISMGLIFYKQRVSRLDLIWTIIKAWLFGFLADAAGVILLLFLVETLDIVGHFEVWDNVLTTSVYFLIIALVGLAIYLFNFLQLRKIGIERAAGKRVALMMGILTTPWIILIPPSATAHWL